MPNLVGGYGLCFGTICTDASKHGFWLGSIGTDSTKQQRRKGWSRSGQKRQGRPGLDLLWALHRQAREARSCRSGAPSAPAKRTGRRKPSWCRILWGGHGFCFGSICTDATKQYRRKQLSWSKQRRHGRPGLDLLRASRREARESRSCQTDGPTLWFQLHRFNQAIQEEGIELVWAKTPRSTWPRPTSGLAPRSPRITQLL